MAFDPFPADALDANRRGALSEAQQKGFAALATSRRKSALSGAGFLTAGALLILFFASPKASPTARVLIPIGGLAIAAVLAVRALTGGDAFTQDLRAVSVQSTEGAIGKRRIAGNRGPATHFLDVGDQAFKVGGLTYRTAPDAGFVRVYFLPRSRRLVNLERLPNPPPPRNLTMPDLVSSVGAALRSPTRKETNEARATLAGIGEALTPSRSSSIAPPPAEARDPRPLAEAILGTWKTGFMKVTFTADGRATLRTLGPSRDGHWSVDSAGRLHADITGKQVAAEAWVTGDQLTIVFEGEGLTFTSDSSA
jgi:hypothetical protein